MNVTLIVAAILGGGGIAGAITAWVKVKPERESIIVNAAQGAVHIQTSLLTDLRTELERQAEHFQREIDRMNGRVERVTKDLERVTAERDQLREERDQLKGRVDELEAKVERLENGDVTPPA